MLRENSFEEKCKIRLLIFILIFMTNMIMLLMGWLLLGREALRQFLEYAPFCHTPFLFPILQLRR